MSTNTGKATFGQKPPENIQFPFPFKCRDGVERQAVFAGQYHVADDHDEPHFMTLMTDGSRHAVPVSAFPVKPQPATPVASEA